MGVGIGLLLLLVEAGVGFLTLDLLFRYIPLGRLTRSDLRRWAWLYGWLAALWTLVGLWSAWMVAGGVAAATLLPAPALWWMLWRFGLRKQFPFLFGGIRR